MPSLFRIAAASGLESGCVSAPFFFAPGEFNRFSETLFYAAVYVIHFSVCLEEFHVLLK